MQRTKLFGFFRLLVRGSFPEFFEGADAKFLYCVSDYLLTLYIKFSKISFKNYSGFSDHSIGISGKYLAFARGAQIVEKHFTLDKEMYGPDHKGSMEPHELKLLSTYRDDLSQIN